MEETPLCSSVERDLGLSFDELTTYEPGAADGPSTSGGAVHAEGTPEPLDAGQGAARAREPG